MGGIRGSLKYYPRAQANHTRQVHPGPPAAEDCRFGRGTLPDRFTRGRCRYDSPCLGGRADTSDGGGQGLPDMGKVRPQQRAGSSRSPDMVAEGAIDPEGCFA
jgi:hypothetical protein